MSWIKEIINDTLKRKDESGVLRWSRTSLTMFTAWVSVLFSFIVDTIKHQGDVNETVFGMMVGVALGAKVTDAWSKKMGTNQTSTTDAK